MGAVRGPDRPTWRLVETAPAPGAWNMAVDEVLLESVRLGGAPTLRFYRWSPACLSLGRNQPLADIDVASLAEVGVDLVRRPTGGRAVFHDDELTYAVALSDRAIGSPRAAYRSINRVLLEALNGLGAAVELQPPGGLPVRIDGGSPCFADAAEGEVLAAGRKLIGSAQARSGGFLLQHGSLPLRPRPAGADLPGWLLGQIGAPAYLARLLDPVPSTDALVSAITAVWSERIGPVERSGLSRSEADRAERVRARFEDPVWTARR